MGLTEKDARRIAAEAMRKYTNGSVSREFMERSYFKTVRDRFTFILELLDLTHAKELHLSEGKQIPWNGLNLRESY